MAAGADDLSGTQCRAQGRRLTVEEMENEFLSNFFCRLTISVSAKFKADRTLSLIDTVRRA
jgi:hypothetical protein